MSHVHTHNRTNVLYESMFIPESVQMDALVSHRLYFDSKRYFIGGYWSDVCTNLMNFNFLLSFRK